MSFHRNLFTIQALCSIEKDSSRMTSSLRCSLLAQGESQMSKRFLFPLVLLSGLGFMIFACAQTEAVRTKAPVASTVAQSKHPEADFSMSCLECHQSTTPEVTAEWESSKHGQVNVGCFVCHGDGEVEFYNKPQGERCIGCHSPQEVDFTKLPVKTCFGCHDGHDLKFHQ